MKSMSPLTGVTLFIVAIAAVLVGLLAAIYQFGPRDEPREPQCNSLHIEKFSGTTVVGEWDSLGAVWNASGELCFMDATTHNQACIGGAVQIAGCSVRK